VAAAPGIGPRLPEALLGQRWIVVCSEGYTSSLAAASLRSLGIDATDLIGGVHAWFAGGLPLVVGPTPVEQIAGRTGSANLGNFGGPHVEDKSAH